MGTTQSTINKSFAIAGKNAQTRVYLKPQCVKEVPIADNSIYGSCNYYYRPYVLDPLGPTEIYKFKFITIFDLAREIFNSPTSSKSLFDRLYDGKEGLINIKEKNWSRWHDFKGRHRSCGHEPPPYYINYGYYYCSRYVTYLYPSFKTQEARNWLITARKNLQIYLDDALAQNMHGNGIIVITSKKYPDKFIKPPINVGLKNIELLADQFKNMAFTTHVPAYVDANLADIINTSIFSGWIDLFKICLGPRPIEWADSETRQQAIDAAVIVFGDWIGRIIKAIEVARDMIIKTIKDPELAQKKLDELYETVAKKILKISEQATTYVDDLVNVLKKWNPFK
ncbi:hypothetical protein [Acinetobacter gerneri]|uniref:Uncharacterized protein n=2 Tax=Acinetobacter gerneri TaxID=202952 RepID=N8YBY1_9GAMM|nr:hypothetical protein [Acinetobacter gerneri]ENV34126.1 hypothetical protein F960_01816 [Acinetobacter gerneri DSM 14967 = CIP 107464 = MTCC 9824]EPR83572.1 hypothetical protein L289_2106 [Acinetobacter gerneri DSM 14967 = CIP 107464 = MTCC 9824]MDQ9009456.1 hypothetical protein [Acinetobacter gerneri]MDQ9013561.1 hypothetical protein [Acinetobacter gerneri]MDQ9024875.1 hypothetical protein [Acinetobacter gerneri]